MIIAVQIHTENYYSMYKRLVVMKSIYTHLMLMNLHHLHSTPFCRIIGAVNGHIFTIPKRPNPISGICIGVDGVEIETHFQYMELLSVSMVQHSSCYH